jgi:hypothetical protein
VTSRKEIDLIINAGVRGQKNLQAIPKTISELEQALDRQTAAAKRGENSIDELKATLLSLQEVRSVLTGTGGLIGDFKKLTDQITASEGRVDKATKAFDDYRAKIGDIGKATDAQAAKDQKLLAARDRAVATLARQREQYTAMAATLREAGIATENLAESERLALQTAAQLGLVINRNQQAIASYANDVRTARDATKELSDAARVSGQRLGQFLRQQADEAAEQSAALAALKADIIARSAASARDTGLAKTADDAEQAARQFTSLARASKDLSPRIVSVREALASIIDPTKNVKMTVGEVEGEIKRLGDSISTIKGPVKDYQGSMAALKNAQQSLISQAGLIDTFRRQADALRTNRAEFVQARAEVAQYAAKVREGGEAGQSFVGALASAQARLDTASEALNRQLNVTRQARDALRGAGLSTRDLAGEQARLTANANASTAAITQLGAAVQKYGIEKKKAGEGGALGGGPDGERTTLNFMQRLRGQVLSLTAAYVGLFGVINTAKAALDSMIGMEAIESRLAVATESNDPKVIGKEYEYLRGRADYYGVGVQKLAESYGAYAIAAKSAGFANDQTKYTFEQLTGGMRVLKMNTDQQGRAWTQLQQILSKTKPEMEDIKTVAESGFVGVQGMMARGLRSIGVEGIRAGTEISDMFKLMKDGALDSGQAIYALAVQAEKELGMRVPQAIKTLQAEQGRFETSTFEFKKAIAESGWADAYISVLVKLREMMSGDDGAKAAQAIGSAFKALADILIGVLNNLDTIKIISMALAAIWAGNHIAAAIAGFAAFKTQALATAAALTAVQKGMLVLQAAVVGFAIGTWAYKEFGAVRVYAIYLVTSLEMAFATIKHSFMAAFEVLPNFFGNVMRKIVNGMTASTRMMGTLLAKLASAVGMDGVADALNKGVEAMTLSFNNTEDIISNRKAQLQRDLAAIKAIREDMLNDEYGGVPQAAAPGAPVADPTGAPGKPKSRLKEDEEKAKAAAKKRLAEIEEITKALESLNAKSEKAQVDSLENQLKAVDLQFASLSRKIKELGGKEGAEFGKQFADGVASLKGQITENFNKKLLAEQEALQKKLEDAEVASGRRSTSNLDARLKAVATRYEQTYRDIAAYREKLEANNRDTGPADAMKERLDGEVKTLQNMERQKFAYDELKRFEGEMQDLLQTRAARVKTINDMEEGSLITDMQAREHIQATMIEMQPQIEALAGSASEFALSLGAAFDPARSQQFLASMQLGVTSMQRLKKEVGLTAAQVDERLATGLTNAFDVAAKGVTEAIAGQKSWGEAIRNTGRAFLQFAADFLREIALMITKQLILNALKNSGWGAGIAGLFGVKHDGGVIGHANSRTRSVSPAWFANAPRYHTGGVAGLAPDEYPTILQRGEEVLAADSPRNVLNGGAGLGGQQQAQPQGVRFVLVDDRSKVAEAMATSEGERVIVEAIRRNAATVRQMVR